MSTPEKTDVDGVISDYREDFGATQLSRMSYLLKSGFGSDLTVIVGEHKKSFKVHKGMLMVSSPVFEKIFTEEPARDTLEIPELDSEIFLLFLKFLYTGIASKKLKDIIPLLNIARYYNVPDLTKLCTDILSSKLEKDTAVTIFQQSVQYNEKDTTEASKKIICKYASEIVDSEEFLELTTECLEQLLGLDDLAVNDELQLFEALLRWAEAECRRQGTIITPKYCHSVLERLIPYIRFPQMTAAEFSLKVAFRNILTQEQLLSISLYFNIPHSQRSEVPPGQFNSTLRQYVKLASNLSSSGVGKGKMRYTVDSVQLNGDLSSWEYVSGKRQKCKRKRKHGTYTVDSLCFQISHPGKLVSFGIFGQHKPNTEVHLQDFKVRLSVKDCDEEFPFVTTTKTIDSKTLKGIFHVTFPAPVPLLPGIWYVVQFKSTDPWEACVDGDQKILSRIDRPGEESILIQFKDEFDDSDGPKDRTRQILQFCFEF